MARAYTLYLYRANVPGFGPLQEAVKALKLKVALDGDYKPFETSGYLPCTFDGEDAGFTIRFREIGEDGAKFPALGAALQGRDVAIDIKWSGDVREYVSALAVSAAFAKGFGALVLAGEGDKLLSGDQLVSRVRSEMDAIDG